MIGYLGLYKCRLDRGLWLHEVANFGNRTSLLGQNPGHVGLSVLHAGLDSTCLCPGRICVKELINDVIFPDKSDEIGAGNLCNVRYRLIF